MASTEPAPFCPKCGHVHTLWIDSWDNGMTTTGWACETCDCEEMA
jgi:hypothetical protein